MFLDNTIGNRNSQSYAFSLFLGGKKWLKQFGNIIFGDTGAGVPEIYL